MFSSFLGIYVAPLFSSFIELDKNMKSGTITKNSVAIMANKSNNRCGYITYTNSCAIYHCKPLETNIFSLEKLIEKAKSFQEIDFDTFCKNLGGNEDNIYKILNKNRITVIKLIMEK